MIDEKIARTEMDSIKRWAKHIVLSLSRSEVKQLQTFLKEVIDATERKDK